MTIEDAKKYLNEKPSPFLTKDRRLKRSAVLIEGLVKEIERRDVVIEAANAVSNREIQVWMVLDGDDGGAEVLDELDSVLKDYKALSQLEDK